MLASTAHNTGLDALIKKVLDKTPQKAIRDFCRALSKHLQQIAYGERGYIEKIFYIYFL